MRGFGLPGCGRGVTVPTSRKPKPSVARPARWAAFLSRPAASPTRIGKLDAHHRDGRPRQPRRDNLREPEMRGRVERAKRRVVRRFRIEREQERPEQRIELMHAGAMVTFAPTLDVPRRRPPSVAARAVRRVVSPSSAPTLRRGRSAPPTPSLPPIPRIATPSAPTCARSSTSCVDEHGLRPAHADARFRRGALPAEDRRGDGPAAGRAAEVVRVRAAVPDAGADRRRRRVLARNAAALERAEREYGVPRGDRSSRSSASRRTTAATSARIACIDALTTLAFDYPRRATVLPRRAQGIPAARARAGAVAAGAEGVVRRRDGRAAVHARQLSPLRGRLRRRRPRRPVGAARPT